MKYTSKHSIGVIRYNYITLMLIFFYCRDFFYLVFQRITHSGTISQVMCLFLIYGCFLICISRKKRVLKQDALFVIFLIVVLFALSYILNPDYRTAITELESWNALDSVFTFSSGIFAYLFFRAFDDDEQLLSSLKPCAYILLLWALFRINSSISSGGFSRVMQDGVLSQNSYDMATGYRLLFVSLIFGLEFLNGWGIKKVWYAILTAGSTVGMFIYGSRTAAISWVLFWILRILFCGNKRHSTKRIIMLMVILMLTILITNVAFLQTISTILSGIGMQSRILDTLIQQEISLDLGRTRMWTTCIEMIKAHPLLGNGIFADRAQFGIYCHQIILEILVDFGCVAGGAILLVLVILVVKGLTCRDNSQWKLLFVMFLSMCIVRLMMSSSFWMDTNFWATLAILVNQKKNLKQHIIKGI